MIKFIIDPNSFQYLLFTALLPAHGVGETLQACMLFVEMSVVLAYVNHQNILEFYLPDSNYNKLSAFRRLGLEQLARASKN